MVELELGFEGIDDGRVHGHFGERPRRRGLTARAAHDLRRPLPHGVARRRLHPGSLALHVGASPSRRPPLPVRPDVEDGELFERAEAAEGEGNVESGRHGGRPLPGGAGTHFDDAPVRDGRQRGGSVDVRRRGWGPSGVGSPSGVAASAGVAEGTASVATGAVGGSAPAGVAAPSEEQRRPRAWRLGRWRRPRQQGGAATTRVGAVVGISIAKRSGNRPRRGAGLLSKTTRPSRAADWKPRRATPWRGRAAPWAGGTSRSLR